MTATTPAPARAILPAEKQSPANLVNMTGLTYGHFCVIERAGRTPRGLALWLCKCVCGNELAIEGAKLRSGHTTSCGCMKGKANRTHGMRGTPTHNSWCAMKQRCNYPKNDQYADYGGRGIRVCDRWNKSFEAFLADMGERPEGMTIERKDTNGNYEPGNCRWATMPEQQRNRRSTILVERGGITKCVKDWCDDLCLNVDRVYGRIRRGATPAEALR